MSKQNEGSQDHEDVIEVTNIVETKDEEGNDTTDWKALAMERDELARKNYGIAQRYKTKAEKAKEEKPEKKPIEKNEQPSNDFGEKAYLIANGIKSKDEIDLVLRLKKETGKDVESLMDSTYFQTELKAFRDQKNTDNAVPSNNKRSNNSTVDSVDYWLAKDELPPKEQAKLRAEVINAKMKTEQTKGVFYNS